MIIVAGHLLVHAADRDRYVADCAPAVEAARERWESRAQLSAFRGAGPGDDLRERIVAVNVGEYEVA
jgi:hypothetical protein